MSTKKSDKNKNKMYSPKISEDLIPELYQMSRMLMQPMTKTVDDILRNYLNIYKIHNNISPRTLNNVLEYVLEHARDELS